MQHKFPFVVIHFQVDGEKIDVNVHPTKMEMRFQRQQDVYNIVYEGVHRTLLEPELIPQVEAPAPKVISQPKSESPFLLKPKTAPQPMEKKPEEKEEPHDEAYFMKKMKERVLSYHQRNSSAEVAKKSRSSGRRLRRRESKMHLPVQRKWRSSRKSRQKNSRN